MSGATDVLAEVLLHGTVATLVVESLIHWVPVRSPAHRFPYRVSALMAPVLLAPLFGTLASVRKTDGFQDLSLFVSARWELLQVGPTDARTLALGLAAVAGGLLLARDVAHVVLDARRAREQERRLTRVPLPPRVRATVASLSSTLGIAPPTVELVEAAGHMLHCRGWWRPRVLMSTGTLADVTDEELQASLAHELAHVHHRDVSRGWLLLALRSLQWFNPFAQALGRRAAHELEWRADDRAASLTGAPLALAHALVRCARRRGDRFLGLSGQGRMRTLEERCRRLMGAPDDPDDPGGRWGVDLVLLWSGLAALLVFVQ